MHNNLKVEGRTLYFIALHVMIIAFGIQIFVLTKQNEQLKESQDPYWAGRLKVGDMFAVDSLYAVSTTTGYPVDDRNRQLIFVFSTKCKFCKANIDAWREITLGAKTNLLRIYAVSLDSAAGTMKYLAENRGINYDVYVPLDIAHFARNNRLGGVPLTVLRSPTGNVEKYWNGALDNKQIREIVRLISD